MFDSLRFTSATCKAVFKEPLRHGMNPGQSAGGGKYSGIAVRREVDDLFQQAVPLGNTVPRDELKDLVPDAELSLPAFNVVTGSYDPRSLKSTLLEFKTMRYGVKYTSVPRATAVDRFERSLLGDIQRGLAARDAAWHNTEPGQKGPLRDILDMSEYTGMVFGTVATPPPARIPESPAAPSEAASQHLSSPVGPHFTVMTPHARLRAACDTTLEVNDGAARFNADDGFLVGLPEHVWPALHAFRTSIKASVGLEVRFDKMQAYSADMEAARPEAPADIEWPELDGHHGIAVLNVPLGSSEYVQAYMRGKAEELREEVEAFAEAVNATILAAIERVLGVSFDPSTYGTDTNPVVTDFLAELLHDPDPMAAEVATLSEDAVARARSRLHLPTRLKGAGIRRMATVRDAAFIGCMNAILPRFLTRNSGTNTPTPCFFDPQLGSVLGRGSFNATSSARQYDHFLNDAHGSDSYAAEMRERLLLAISATQIILPSTEHNPVTVDLYGDALMNLPAHGDAHWCVHHDAIADAFRDHCVHDLGIAVRREVDDLFQQAVPLGNTVPRDELKDLVPDAELSLPAFNVVTGSYDPRSLKSTLLEFKTMRYGVKYTSVPRATAVGRFERSMLGDIQRGLAARDAAWHNTEPGQKGSLRDILDMSEYTGMAFGSVGEVSKGVRRTVCGIACLAADRGALSSRGTRCITRAHQEALLARDFLGVLSLVAARERARCLISDGADSSAIPLLKLHSTSEDHPHTHVHAWPGL
eukprot:jgi/Tetstr1/425761/TSEL_016180.t1